MKIVDPPSATYRISPSSDPVTAFQDAFEKLLLDASVVIPAEIVPL
jgi:hypothetical protein